jgi:hypothetical protein
MDRRVSTGHDGIPACFSSQTVPAIPVIAPASEKQDQYKNNQNG